MFNDLVYELPLIAVISLVYAGTRHERMGAILAHAARFGTWVCVFIVAAYGLMQWLSSGL